EPRRACAFSRAALVCKIDGQARPARVPFLNYAAALITSAWLAAGIVPGLAAPLPDEIGVLTCTVGAIVSATSAAAAGDGAREMFCAFKTGMGPEETYAGLLRSIGDDPLEGR